MSVRRRKEREREREREREMVMVMVMEKITRHLLSGGRMLDLWTSPEAARAGQGKGPALDHAEILLRLRIIPLAATTAARVFAAAGRHAPPPEGGLQHHRLGVVQAQLPEGGLQHHRPTNTIQCPKTILSILLVLRNLGAW